MMMTSGEAVKYKSSLHAFNEIVKKEGTKSLFKGAGMHDLYLASPLPSLPLSHPHILTPLSFSSSFGAILTGFFLLSGANILRAVAGAGVLAGYDKLQILVFGKAYSSGGG